MKKIIALSSVLVLTALVLAQGRLELRAELTGTGKGKAVWKTRDAGGQLQAELQVESENLPRNTPYTVNVGAASFQTMTNGFGKFSISQRYTTSARPSISAGTPVTVVNLGGVTVQSGAFH